MISSTALKEWASVIEALGTGQQLLLLRKGGIRDPNGEFRLDHREFLLFPAWEHQAEEMIRPELRGRFKAALAPPQETSHVTFRLYAGVAYEAPVRKVSQLEGLEEHHIWTPEFFQKRLVYRPAEPTLLMVVRAYRLPKPVSLPADPSYAGCRSWVPVKEPVSAEGAQPVMDNRKFLAALEKISARVER